MKKSPISGMKEKIEAAGKKHNVLGKIKNPFKKGSK